MTKGLTFKIYYLYNLAYQSFYESRSEDQCGRDICWILVILKPPVCVFKQMMRPVDENCLKIHIC